MAGSPSPPPSVGDRPQGSVGRSAARGVMWTSLSGMAERLIGFFALALVVRLMTVEEAGIAMLAASTFDVILVVSTAGFGDRIIQNPTIDRVLQGTVFWLQMLVCSLFAVAFFLCAVPLSRLFDEPRIVPLLQVMSSLIVLRAIPVLPSALLARSMRYGPMSIGTLLTSLASAVTGVAVALAGYPVWSLVAQFVASALVYTTFIFAYTRWRPPLAFSPVEAWRTITFATPLLGSSSMVALSAQASTLMIGAWLPIEAVAFYRIAARLSEVMGQVLITPVQRVLLSTFSTLRADRGRLHEAFLNLLRVLAAVAFCVYALVGAQGADVMRLLFGQVWGASGPILAILMLGVVGVVLRGFVGPALTAVGRTRLVLLYTAVVTVAIVAAVAIASPFGVLAVAGAQVAVLTASIPLGLLMFRVALELPASRVAMVLPVPMLAAGAGAAASYAANLWLAGAAASVPLVLRVGAAAAAGGLAFVVVHLVLAPRRSLESVRALHRLLRPGRAPAGA